MKIHLEVLTPGTMQGKKIPIKLMQFLIGRDKQCHLRPASPIVSNRHCALLVRGNRVFVRDFESTNGTLINERAVRGEVEVRDQDEVRVGPLVLRVCLEATPQAEKAEPIARPRAAAEAMDDEAMAALLLSLPEEGGPPSESTAADSQGVPTGATVMDVPVPAGAPEPEEEKPAPQKPAGGTEADDTATVANSLLQKYLRRGRR